MKWVGRVLLIGLIASTLFVAKQSDFQTETAFAQTGSSDHLTLDLNDIEVRVVKNDNSSSTTAGSAIVDNQTTMVYFNNIKVINNSNEDIVFRLNAQFFYGTIPGDCVVLQEISCNYRERIYAGQTLTLPDNTVHVHSDMFSYNSGQYRFQTLALQGINKADLDFTLSGDSYNAVRVTKSQILKWSAVRVKLQNAAGIPVSNKRVGLYKEGESNTTLPGDPWRSGNTNSTGQAAMALLDPITYTTRYLEPPSQTYTDLQPPVVVADPDFQDLTFTICDGGTGGQGFLVERAQAQAQQCLPDFIVDLNNAETIINGRSVSPAHLYVQMGVFEIRNVAIKNIGTAPGIPGAVIVVLGANEEQRALLPDLEVIELFEALITETINPNQQLILPPIRVDMNNVEIQEDFIGLTTLLSKEGSINKAALGAAVNYDYDNYQPVEEYTNENNFAVKESFFDWQAFEITVLAEKDGQTSPQPNASLKIIIKGVYQFEADATDDLGRSFVAMRANSVPTANYTFIADIASLFIGKSEKSVSSFTFERVTVKIDLSDGLIITATPQIPDDDDYTKLIDWEEGVSTGGTVQITADNNQVYVAPLLSNIAIFRGIPADVKTVTVDRITSEITYILLSLEDTITYRWESVKGEPLVFDNDINNHEIALELETKCGIQLTPLIEGCFYEEPNKINEYSTSLVPIYSKVLSRMESSFDPSIRLKLLKKVWMLAYYNRVGTADSSSLYIETMTRYPAYAGKLFAEDLIMHEAMHILDYQLGSQRHWLNMFSSDNSSYRDSVEITANGLDGTQVSAETGRWAWQYLGHTCSVMPESIKNKCIGHTDPRSGEVEIFAEQATNACLFPKETVATLRNYSSIYASNPLLDDNGSPIPEPPDLKAHRDIIASRSLDIGNSSFGMGNIIYNVDSSWKYTIGYSYILQTIMSSCSRSK